MAKANTRLPGHELWSEGAPYRRGDQAHVRCGGWMLGTSGEGYAVCSCGATSEVLTSANKRKQWHRDHKQTIKNETNAATVAEMSN